MAVDAKRFRLFNVLEDITSFGNTIVRPGVWNQSRTGVSRMCRTIYIYKSITSLHFALFQWQAKNDRNLRL